MAKSTMDKLPKSSLTDSMPTVLSATILLITSIFKNKDISDSIKTITRTVDKRVMIAPRIVFWLTPSTALMWKSNRLNLANMAIKIELRPDLSIR
jgi:hypothetical protein